MKNTLLTLAIIGAAYNSYGQTNIYEFGTNVGIGISNPSGKLGKMESTWVILTRNCFRKYKN